jgi:hypothetical protein
VGGCKSFGLFAARTVRLVRSQKVEIKYKKPTSIIATLRLAAPAINCGGGESEMIRGDSFSRILIGLGRPYQACQAARRQSAGHCGGIATNLNRFESLQRNPDRCSGQGGGGYKSLQPLGRVTARGSRTDFLWPETFEFFSRNQRIQTGPRRGAVKSLGLLGVDRAGGLRESPRNSELFFPANASCAMRVLGSVRPRQPLGAAFDGCEALQKNAAKFRVGGVAGCLPSG